MKSAKSNTGKVRSRNGKPQNDVRSKQARRRHADFRLESLEERVLMTGLPSDKSSVVANLTSTVSTAVNSAVNP